MLTAFPSSLEKGSAPILLHCKDASFSHAPNTEMVNQKDLGRRDAENGEQSQNLKVSEVPLL